MDVKADSTVVNLGRHLLAEFYDCNPNILNNLQLVQEAMLSAATACGATVVDSKFHHFSPYGVSGAVIISESHLAIHTWPEYGYAAVDLFTCGTACDPRMAYEHLQEKFKSGSAYCSELKRGLINLTTQKMIESPFQLEAQSSTTTAAPHVVGSQQLAQPQEV